MQVFVRAGGPRHGSGYSIPSRRRAGETSSARAIRTIVPSLGGYLLAAVLMILSLGALVLAVSDKNWFISALVLALAVIIYSAVGLGKKRPRCPDCAESIDSTAGVCRYCGYRFEESA